jgi:hypothetical protein
VDKYKDSKTHVSQRAGAKLRWGRPGPWPAQDFDVPLYFFLGWPTKAANSRENRALLNIGPPRNCTVAPPLPVSTESSEIVVSLSIKLELFLTTKLTKYSFNYYTSQTSILVINIIKPFLDRRHQVPSFKLIKPHGVTCWGYQLRGFTTHARRQINS